MGDRPAHRVSRRGRKALNAAAAAGAGPESPKSQFRRADGGGLPGAAKRPSAWLFLPPVCSAADSGTAAPKRAAHGRQKKPAEVALRMQHPGPAAGYQPLQQATALAARLQQPPRVCTCARPSLSLRARHANTRTSVSASQVHVSGSCSGVKRHSPAIPLRGGSAPPDPPGPRPSPLRGKPAWHTSPHYRASVLRAGSRRGPRHSAGRGPRSCPELPRPGGCEACVPPSRYTRLKLVAPVL